MPDPLIGALEALAHEYEGDQVSRRIRAIIARFPQEEEETAEFAWNEVIDAFQHVWPGDDLIYDYSPIELIYRLRNERNDWEDRAKAKAEAGEPCAWWIKSPPGTRYGYDHITTDPTESISGTTRTPLYLHPVADAGLRRAARRLIDLHTQEQEGLVPVTFEEWMAATDALAAQLGPHPGPEGVEVRDELVRSVHRASRRIWGFSLPEHSIMMVRPDDAERIMREEILGETFSESPQPPGKPA